jgi:hypothetical protein
MLKPAKMKQIVITLLSQDADTVIKYLGRSGIMQFSPDALPPPPPQNRARPPIPKPDIRPGIPRLNGWKRPLNG